MSKELECVSQIDLEDLALFVEGLDNPSIVKIVRGATSGAGSERVLGALVCVSHAKDLIQDYEVHGDSYEKIELAVSTLRGSFKENCEIMQFPKRRTIIILRVGRVKEVCAWLSPTAIQELQLLKNELETLEWPEELQV